MQNSLLYFGIVCTCDKSDTVAAAKRLYINTDLIDLLHASWFIIYMKWPDVWSLKTFHSLTGKRVL